VHGFDISRGGDRARRSRAAPRARLRWACLCAGLLTLLAPHAAAQPAPAPPPSAPIDDRSPYEGRPVSEIRFVGVKRVDEVYIRNQVRTAVGQPLVWRTVREDLRRLERLGEFSDIQADVLVDEQDNVIVQFRLVEAPIVQDVVVVGNRQISDEEISNELAGVISLFRGIPIDEFQIGRAQRLIEDLYRRKGFYQVQVTVDRSELETNGIVAFRVREGERLKVTAIRFEGNRAFPARLLQTHIKTRTSGLLQTGALDDSVLDSDVAALLQFYLDRGYLDIRASRRVQPAPNGKEAIVTFLLDEGQQYTVRRVTATRAPEARDDTGGATRGVSEEQVRGVVPLKPGDVIGQTAVREATDALRDAYQKLGFVDARVGVVQRRDPEAPLVDIEFIITEGRRYRAGMVIIQGNTLTQQKVVRREITIRPDRWLDATEARDTEERLKTSRLFDPAGVKVTIQPEDPAQPGHRDVLVEVEETDTGSLSFGAAVDSDAGLTGVINLNQRNFDIADTPDSFDEFIKGRAFRGGGQTFNLAIQPGTEASNYSVSLTEPWFLDLPYSATVLGFFRTREFDQYDEERYGARFALARRFGTRWVGSLSLRAESIDISNVSNNAAVDFLEVEGDNILTSVGFGLTRNTLNNRVRPTKGTVTELGVEQFGALGGDYNFTKLTAAHEVYIPIDEDVLGRITFLTLTTRIGYIPQGPDEAPVFERYYLGGRSFRGFDFRGIGPVGFRTDGTETDEHVGGTWQFFAGLQVEKPLVQFLSVVGFLDTGTLTDDVGFDDYRVAVGAGIRLYLPQLGPAPLAFDFAYPLVDQDTDDRQVFSFSVDLPLQ